MSESTSSKSPSRRTVSARPRKCSLYVWLPTGQTPQRATFHAWVSVPLCQKIEHLFNQFLHFSLKAEATGKLPSKHAAAAGSAAQQQQQSHEAPASTSSASHGPKQSHPYHRKSQSLDASAIISHMNGTPSKSKGHSQTVRER